MKINGKRLDRKHKALGGKKISGAGGKGRSGCLPALATVAVLGFGWASMVLTGSGWAS